MAEVSPLLTVESVSKHYPGTVALADVSLAVAPGELVALLGENGAGKSTLSNVIAGLTQPTGGMMTWRGEPYAPTAPADAISAGIGMIHQEMRLLPELTVAENVLLGRWPRRRGGFVDRRALNAEAARHLTRLGFTRGMDTVVRDLSVAGQQQVEIARALALSARLLILDEPTAALGHQETDALFDCIEQLKADGVAFVYISHRLAEIRRIADRIVVLRDGNFVAEHDNGEVGPDQLVAEMVGRSVDRLFPERGTPREETVLEVVGLSGARGEFRDVDFSVRAGEILGIAGIVGAGRTELVRAVSGADRPGKGQVLVDGKPLKPGSVPSAIRSGLVMVPEDRRRQGVILPMTVGENLALPNPGRVSVRGWLSATRGDAFAQEFIARLGVRGRADSRVANLSGGNQQKVVLGKWIARAPRVVILDEPTRGIDVGARAAIYEVIAELAAEGLAVIVVSSDLEEVLGLAHRVLVLARGRSQGELAADELSAESVMARATR